MAAVNGMRVLYLGSRLPTVVQNGLELRVRNQVLATAESFPTGLFAVAGSGQPISPLIEFWASGSDPKPAQGVPLRIALQRGISDPNGPYWMRYSDQTGRDLINAINEFKPTIIVFERLEVIPYLETVKLVFNGPVVLDLDEVSGPLNDSMIKQTTDKQERITRRIWSQLVGKYEARMIPRFDHVWVSSKKEESNFLAAFGESHSVSVVPNSIDIDSYAMNQSDRESKKIVFTGSFGYLPNTNAVEFLIKSVLPLLPGFTLDVIGTLTPTWLRELNNPQVNIVGEVRNVAPYLRRGSVAVVPIFSGGGSRLKVLEAMACGTPVVGTSFGIDGHDLTPGVNVILAHSAEEFAFAIKNLEMNPAYQQELSENAFVHVKKFRSLESLRAQIEIEFLAVESAFVNVNLK